MSTHRFMLVLERETELTQELEDSLFEAGCDDATISVQEGIVCLTFDREAGSLGEAMKSAVRDIHKAGLELLDF